MIITCQENYRESLKKDKDYLAIEIYTNIRTQKISYRVCDEQGTLAIYDNTLFLIKEPGLNNYSMKINKFNTQIMINELLDLDKTSSNLEGVWGDYFDRDERTILKVNRIIQNQAEIEKIDIQKISI